MTAQNSAAQNSTHQRLEDSPQIPWAKNAAVDSAQAGGIRFENITKSYPSRTGEPTTVLQNLNLHIPAGQITVFVGPSGCGKTTSLRMINRMVEPNNGTITIDGVNVHEKNPYELRRGIGYVMQQGGLMPHRTVAQNIATVPRLLGASRKEAQARALELLEVVGLDSSYAKRYPSQLSGGQVQRVGVARALAADAPVLLMDEPFSAVDPVVRTDLQKELLRLRGNSPRRLCSSPTTLMRRFCSAIQSPSSRRAAASHSSVLQKRFSTAPPMILCAPSSAAPLPVCWMSRRCARRAHADLPPPEKRRTVR